MRHLPVNTPLTRVRKDVTVRRFEFEGLCFVTDKTPEVKTSHCNLPTLAT